MAPFSIRAAMMGVSGLVLLALGLHLHGRDPPPANGMRDDDTQEQLAALRDEMARLKRARAGDALLATRQLSELRIAEPATPGEEASEGPTRPQDLRPQTLQEAVAESSEMADQLDGVFESEQSDPGWSGAASRDMQAALSDALPGGTTLMGIECRSRLCRVESRHDSLESFQSYVDASFLSRERKVWNGAYTSLVTSHTPSGVHAVSFLTREGHEMPSLDL